MTTLLRHSRLTTPSPAIFAEFAIIQATKDEFSSDVVQTICYVLLTRWNIITYKWLLYFPVPTIAVKNTTCFSVVNSGDRDDRLQGKSLSFLAMSCCSDNEYRYIDLKMERARA